MNRLVLVALVSIFLTVPAGADIYYGQVDVKYNSVAPGQVVGIWSSNGNYTGGTGFWTGVYNIDLTNLSDVSLPAPAPAYAGVPDTWNPYLTGTVQSFCIDIWDLAPTSPQTYNIVPLGEAPDPQSAPYGGMGDLRAAYLAELLDRYWTDAYLNTANTVENNLRAAALQTAIWEIVDEQSIVSGDPSPAIWNASYGQGNFYVGNSYVANRANDMLNAIRADGKATPIGDYAALSSPSLEDPKTNFQDYVVKVPIPTAVLLGMLGLGAAGLKLRRFA